MNPASKEQFCATLSLSNRFAHVKSIDGLHYENIPMQYKEILSASFNLVFFFFRS